MSQTKYDYDLLEQEYITGGDEVSIRELARRHGIASWSTVSSQAKQRHWDQKRAEYRSQVSQKSIAMISDKTATKAAEIKDDFLTVLHAAILKMATDMRGYTIDDFNAKGEPIKRFVPGIIITPSDLTKLISTMQTLLGNPSTISENRNLGISIGSGLPPDILRELASLAADPEPGEARRAALPGARATGPN